MTTASFDSREFAAGRPERPVSTIAFYAVVGPVVAGLVGLIVGLLMLMIGG